MYSFYTVHFYDYVHCVNKLRLTINTDIQITQKDVYVKTKTKCHTCIVSIDRFLRMSDFAF